MNITRITPLALSALMLAALPAVAQNTAVPLDRGNERLSEDNIDKRAVENAPKLPAVRPANTLPSDAAGPEKDIVYTPEYL